MPKSFVSAKAALSKLALAYPDTREDHPWGHSAFKVKGKVFLFLFYEKDTLSLSLKLPESAKLALSLPFASPTSYGLGKAGWVTARFQGQAEVLVEMLAEWMDESFRAIAPKRVLAKLASRRSKSVSAQPKRSASQRRERPAGRKRAR
jgi:predicted DNA-binding protein (MmcQ/YjbR family)